MCYLLISVLSILAVIPFASLAKTLSPRWDNMHVKHSWSAVPENWESTGRPLNGTTIDLYVALKAHRENALIDALSEVSDPNHPRHVSSIISSLMHILTSVAALMQIRGTLVQGAGCGACRSAPRNP